MISGLAILDMGGWEGGREARKEGEEGGRDGGYSKSDQVTSVSSNPFASMT